MTREIYHSAFLEKVFLERSRNFSKLFCYDFDYENFFHFSFFFSRLCFSAVQLGDRERRGERESQPRSSRASVVDRGRCRAAAGARTPRAGGWSRRGEGGSAPGQPAQPHPRHEPRSPPHTSATTTGAAKGARRCAPRCSAPLRGAKGLYTL